MNKVIFTKIGYKRYIVTMGKRYLGISEGYTYNQILKREEINLK